MTEEHHIIWFLYFLPHRRQWRWWGASLQGTQNAWWRTWTQAGCSARAKACTMRPVPATSRPEQLTKACARHWFLSAFLANEEGKRTSWAQSAQGNRSNGRIWTASPCRLPLPTPCTHPQSPSPLLLSSCGRRTPLSPVAGEGWRPANPAPPPKLLRWVASQRPLNLTLPGWFR